MKILTMLWLLLLITSYCLVQAQIPKVCSNKTILISRTCCPVPSGASAACGGDLGRGRCRPVSEYCNTGYTEDGDPRLNWPSYFFSQTCHCNGNYAGYDCGECKFGYEGENCNTKSSLRQRQNLADMTDSEWDEYNTKLNRSKHADESRYVILVFNETDGNTFNAEAVDISIFDMFVWMHHYVGKNNDDHNSSGSANDYAHESTGFLTWHRLYLLWFERELQILLNDASFTVRYWNWTNPDDRTSIFSASKLGERGVNGSVISRYYGGNNWKSICWFPSGSAQTCDPRDPIGIRPIIRCPSPTECASDYSRWPSAESVESALQITSFSNAPYNKHAVDSFRNFLEGFDPDADPNSDMEVSSDNITRLLHNLVHIILGLGTVDSLKGTDPVIFGTMIDIASPNDPVFINHHTMVDYIFEQWLQKYPNGVYGGPSNDRKFAGHSSVDCIVPFMPLYTHMDMFKPAEDFGYSYDSLPPTGSGVTIIKGDLFSFAVLMLVSIIAALFFM